MEKLVKTYICKTNGLEVNTVRQVSVKGFDDEFAVFRLADGYYVTDDLCTHGMVSLSGGDIEDGQIFCPLHDGAFDIRTGEATALPCRIHLKTYEVEVDGDDLYAYL